MASMTAIKDEFVGTSEAAKLLNVTDGRIRQLIRATELRAIKIAPRFWAISLKEIDRYKKKYPERKAP